MPLAPIPPWLQINPSQFIDAAKAGTQLGIELAQTRTRADEANAGFAARADALRATQEEAAARLEASQQLAVRAEAFKRWEMEQRLRQAALEDRDRRAADAAQLAETTRYHTGVLEHYKDALGGQAEKASAAAAAKAAAVLQTDLKAVDTMFQRKKIDLDSDPKIPDAPTSENLTNNKRFLAAQLDAMWQEARNQVYVRHGLRSTTATGAGPANLGLPGGPPLELPSEGFRGGLPQTPGPVGPPALTNTTAAAPLGPPVLPGMPGQNPLTMTMPTEPPEAPASVSTGPSQNPLMLPSTPAAAAPAVREAASTDHVKVDLRTGVAYRYAGSGDSATDRNPANWKQTLIPVGQRQKIRARLMQEYVDQQTLVSQGKLPLAELRSWYERNKPLIDAVGAPVMGIPAG